MSSIFSSDQALSYLNTMAGSGKQFFLMPNYKKLPAKLKDHPALNSRVAYDLMKNVPMSLDQLVYTVPKFSLDDLIDASKGQYHGDQAETPLIVRYENRNYVVIGNMYLCFAIMNGFHDLSMQYIDADSYEQQLIKQAGKPKADIQLSDVVTKSDLESYLVGLLNKRRMTITYPSYDLGFRQIFNHLPIANDPEFKKYMKTSMLPISKLISMQKDVKVNTLLDILQSPGNQLMDPSTIPLVIRYLDRYYIYNGHHRIWLLQHLGYKELPIELLDVDSYEREKSLKAWRIYWE